MVAKFVAWEVFASHAFFDLLRQYQGRLFTAGLDSLTAFALTGRIMGSTALRTRTKPAPRGGTARMTRTCALNSGSSLLTHCSPTTVVAFCHSYFPFGAT